METAIDLILNGIPALSNIVHAAARVSVGVFFATSGYHKLFNAERRAKLRRTFEADGIPFIPFNMWLVPLTEFIGGAMVAAGLLTVPAAAMLLAICVVALCCDGIPSIPRRWQPIDAADWVCDVLYLPETLLIILIGYLISSGAGEWSLDWVISQMIAG